MVKNMFKKFIVCFFCIVLSVLIAAGSVVYIVDPFNHYRANSDLTKIIYTMPYYQNVGIAKYTKYDTLITGSSMTQNFRAWWFDEKLNCKAIRLSFDGGITADFEELLKSALSNKNNQLKAVYFGLDNYLITADSQLNKEENRIPKYFIDNNPFTDIKYLLNKDILFNYLVTYNSYKNYSDYDFYEMHAWDNNNPNYSAKSVLSDFTIKPFEEKKPLNYFIGDCDNFISRVGKIVKENPQIDFIFFAPPYSIMYWYDQLSRGTLDATVYALNYTYSKLLENKNVRMFYFQNEFSMITDLDKYKDANHYCTDYNKYMLECFVSGKDEITAENYQSVINEMKSYAESYDFETLLQQK